MNEIIAKRYVKALLANLQDNELEEIFLALKNLASAFLMDKFKMLLNSPNKSGEQKAEFLYSLCEIKNPKIHNMLKLLAENKKLPVLPQIYKEFVYQKDLKNNTFTGIISGNFDLSAQNKKELEDKFSKKLGSSIKFDYVKNSYDGIKIELDDLGFEVSFSMDRLKEQMSEHILKAIQ